MFACIHAPGIDSAGYPKLVNFAAGYSPLLETNHTDSVLLDLRGTELLYGPLTELPGKMESAALGMGLEIRAAIAGNPDAAFHAARGLKKSVYLEPGKENESLRELRLESLSPGLAGISEGKHREMLSTLERWGIHTFAQLAALPESGISERLGPEGVRMQRLASGRSNRSLVVRQIDTTFSRCMDLEFSIALTEPLFLLLNGMSKELFESMQGRGLAAVGIRIRMGLENGFLYERNIQFPFPIRENKTLQRIIELEISANPPAAAVARVELLFHPGKPRGIQSSLFIPGGPEPEKAELILARIGRMTGPEKIGSPELLDSHRPDAFLMKHFQSGLTARKKKSGRVDKSRKGHLAFARIMRPALHSSVWVSNSQPVRLDAPASRIRKGISGKVISASGPWFSSGEWWSEGSWEREEWDLQLDGGELCRIYRDLKTRQWFIDAIYD